MIFIILPAQLEIHVSCLSEFLKNYFSVLLESVFRGQSMWAERKRSGAGRKPTWAERSGEQGSKNQAEHERSGSGRSSEPERSGERAKSAAQNPLHHKTTNVKSFNRFFDLLWNCLLYQD